MNECDHCGLAYEDDDLFAAGCALLCEACLSDEKRRDAELGGEGGEA